MRHILLFLLLPFMGGYAGAQSCSGRISGAITEAHDGERLAYATIYLPALERGLSADLEGKFTIEGVCPGPVEIVFSHIGCEPLRMFFDFQRDTTLDVVLHHHGNFTETVVVNAAETDIGYSERLEERAVQQLGDVLENINGVSSLRTGTAAAKPIYDGLFGNRLSIQNNGIAQAGQQWGSDHAPEIDPWVAAYVRVIDGVDALGYAGSTVGPTVLVEPAPLARNIAPRVRAAYTFRSNGRSHVLNARLTDTTSWLTYRLSGSFKYGGDRRAPGYYLRNTGQREANAAIQLAKFHGPKLTSRLYYSLFTTEIGVLRGSHIGNLSDLEEAIGREVPFFTADTFSYRISSPRQRVAHHLLKAELNYQPSDVNRFTLRYGGQIDDRQEFDVRRGDDDQAALKLLQYSHFLEGVYHRELGNDRHLDAGIQATAITNRNEPGTGILPLIPDYNGRQLATYVTYHRERERLRYQVGLRYDFQYTEAITISRDRPLRIERFTHNYGALGGGIGLNLQPENRLSYQFNVMYRERPPQINELYSQGLHQGISGIEEGDPTLEPERSAKATMGGNYSTSRGRFTVSASLFYQRIANFINLEPEDEFRLTIRGAFPVFTYRSVDASLSGARLTVLAQLGELDIDSRLAITRGWDLNEDRSLVYIPPANWRTSFDYPLPRGFALAVTAYVAFRKQNIEADQDFLPPPPGYVLTDVSIKREWTRGENALQIMLSADNLFDVSYRDYLDRQRYFTDAPGRSINFRAAYSW